MKIALLVTATILFFTSYGQIDTTKIYNCTHLKKGFYRNYKEFINNSPSKNLDFIVLPIYKGQTDSTVVGAKYKAVDSSELKVYNLWGFCDGKDVYVNYSGNTFSSHYWKLINLGPNPFFCCKHKNGMNVFVGVNLVAVALTAVSAVAASLPAEYELMRINKNGKIKDLGVIETYDLLEDQPQLLKEFMAKTDRHLKVDARGSRNAPTLSDAEILKQQNLIIEYLTRLNNILKKG